MEPASDDSDTNLTEVNPKTSTTDLIERAKRAGNTHNKSKPEERLDELVTNKQTDHNRKRKVSGAVDDSSNLLEGSK